MGKEETTTIDKDLYDGLQQARKKKPRNYAVFAKGVEVVGLIVQRKAINDGAVQKAKSECKATLVIQGVCHGEGMELKFEVTGSEPSILPKKIRDFIDEQTELSLKPQWVVVPKLSPVLDDDAAQPTAAAPAPTAVPTAAADDKGLQARLAALVVRQKTLVGKDATLRDHLSSVTKPVADLVLKAAPEAPAALDKLEQTLGGAEQWQEAAAAVAPKFQETLRGKPAEAVKKLQAVMDQCTQLAGTGEYDRAVAGLARLTPLLGGAAPAPSGSAASAPGPGLKPLADRWSAAHQSVSAELQEFREALLAEPEIANDPRLKFVRAASEEILNMLPPGQPVNAALGSNDAAAVKAQIATYRKNLDAAAKFAKLEKFTEQNLGYKLEMRQMLTAALDEMEAALPRT